MTMVDKIARYEKGTAIKEGLSYKSMPERNLMIYRDVDNFDTIRVEFDGDRPDRIEWRSQSRINGESRSNDRIIKVLYDGQLHDFPSEMSESLKEKTEDIVDGTLFRKLYRSYYER